MAFMRSMQASLTFREELEKYSSDAASSWMSSAMRSFAKSKSIVESGNGGTGERRAYLLECVENLRNSIKSSRLVGDLGLEARALGNLGTVLIHLLDDDTALIEEKEVFATMAECLCCFRIKDQGVGGLRSNRNNGGTRNYTRSESQILNNLILHLSSRDHFYLDVAKKLCNVQLGMQVDKAKMETVRKRIETIDKQLSMQTTSNTVKGKKHTKKPPNSRPKKKKASANS